MIQEHQKYRAELFKIIGAALLTPAGTLVFEVLRNGLSLHSQFFAYLIGSIILAFLGIMAFQRGYEELME